MSVTLLIGRTGAGKSYSAVVDHILPALKKGRPVVTNLALNLDFIFRVHPDWVSLLHYVPERANGRSFDIIADYTDYDSIRHPDTGVSPLFVIDEAHKSIPSRTDACSRAVLEWFREHRHTGADVILMTQDKATINRTVLSIVDLMLVARKNLFLGSSKTYRVFVYDGAYGEAVGSPSVRRYNPQFFKYYNSHTKGGVVEHLPPVKSIWSSWLVRFAFLFLAFAIWRFFTVGVPFLSAPDTDLGSVSSGFAVGGELPAFAPASAPALAPVPAPALSPAPVSGSDFARFEGYIFRLSFMASAGGESVFRYSGQAPDCTVAIYSRLDFEAAGYVLESSGGDGDLFCHGSGHCFAAFFGSLPSCKYVHRPVIQPRAVPDISVSSPFNAKKD